MVRFRLRTMLVASLVLAALAGCTANPQSTTSNPQYQRDTEHSGGGGGGGGGGGY